MKNRKKKDGRAGRKAPRPADRVYRCNPVDAVWKHRIRALLAERGISQAELARRIGSSPPAIVALFRPETIQSTLVAPIHSALGLVAPPTSTPVIIVLEPALEQAA